MTQPFSQARHGVWHFKPTYPLLWSSLQKLVEPVSRACKLSTFLYPGPNTAVRAPCRVYPLVPLYPHSEERGPEPPSYILTASFGKKTRHYRGDSCCQDKELREAGQKHGSNKCDLTRGQDILPRTTGPMSRPKLPSLP